MNELEIFLRIAFFGLGLLLLVLTLVSFIRVKEMKIALAAVGFAIFAFSGLVLVGGVFSSDFENMVTIGFLVGVNFVALIFFYLSIIKR